MSILVETNKDFSCRGKAENPLTTRGSSVIQSRSGAKQKCNSNPGENCNTVRACYENVCSQKEVRKVQNYLVRPIWKTLESKLEGNGNGGVKEPETKRAFKKS